MSALPSFSAAGVAVVVGAGGGLGSALLAALQAGGGFHAAIGLGRATEPALDLLDESSIARCAAHVAQRGALRLVIDATGVLHRGTLQPEKSWRQIDPAAMAQAFAINAIGPALLMKHFLPLLPTSGKAVFATLSARVGSISDNQLGGWYSYRASKAALNQLVRTASVELRRRAPAALCVALHPGTVHTALSQPFGKSGLDVQQPEVSAARLLRVIEQLEAKDSGGFFDHMGLPVPW